MDLRIVLEYFTVCFRQEEHQKGFLLFTLKFVRVVGSSIFQLIVEWLDRSISKGSQSAKSTSREPCLEAGMDDFLAKSIKRAQLLKLLERYLVTKK